MDILPTPQISPRDNLLDILCLKVKAFWQPNFCIVRKCSQIFHHSIPSSRIYDLKWITLKKMFPNSWLKYSTHSNAAGIESQLFCNRAWPFPICWKNPPVFEITSIVIGRFFTIPLLKYKISVNGRTSVSETQTLDN